jgi:hypothetical protein
VTRFHSRQGSCVPTWCEYVRTQTHLVRGLDTRRNDRPRLMSTRSGIRSTVRVLAAGAGVAAAAYGAYASVTGIDTGTSRVQERMNVTSSSTGSCRPTKWSSVIPSASPPRRQ